MSTNKKRARAGRPAAPPGEKKGQKVEMFLTIAEKKEVEKKARQAGLSMSTYLRKIIIKK